MFIRTEISLGNMRKTILLIEDDIETQALFTELLTGENYVVVSVYDGQEALDYLWANPAPDLILMDLTFPTMTADHFVAELKKNEKTTGIPIMLVSGKSDIQEYAQRLEAIQFIRKPFDIDPVLEMISASLH